MAIVIQHVVMRVVVMLIIADVIRLTVGLGPRTRRVPLLDEIAAQLSRVGCRCQDGQAPHVRSRPGPRSNLTVFADPLPHGPRWFADRHPVASILRHGVLTGVPWCIDPSVVHGSISHDVKSNEADPHVDIALRRDADVAAKSSRISHLLPS